MSEKKDEKKEEQKGEKENSGHIVISPPTATLKTK